MQHIERKIILVGSSCVGKSTFVHKAINAPMHNCLSKSGATIYCLPLTQFEHTNNDENTLLRSKVIHSHIWDISSTNTDETNEHMYRNADIGILFMNDTPQSQMDMLTYMRNIHYVSPCTKFLICATKSDIKYNINPMVINTVNMNSDKWGNVPIFNYSAKPLNAGIDARDILRSQLFP